MDRLPVWGRGEIELVGVEHNDPKQVKEWVHVLFCHAPGWVCDAVLGDFGDTRSLELVKRLRALLGDAEVK